LGERQRESARLNVLGQMYVEVGDYAAAIEHADQALDLSLTLRTPHMQVSALTTLGSAYFLVNDFKSAHDAYTEGAAIAATSGDKHGESLCLGGLGNLALYTDRFEEALRPFARALAYAESVGDERNAVGWLNNLGRTYADWAAQLKQGNQADQAWHTAQRYLRQALLRARQLAAPAIESDVLLNLGRLYQTRPKRVKRAGQCFAGAIQKLEAVRQTLNEDLHRAGLMHRGEYPYVALTKLCDRAIVK